MQYKYEMTDWVNASMGGRARESRRDERRETLWHPSSMHIKLESGERRSLTVRKMAIAIIKVEFRLLACAFDSPFEREERQSRGHKE
jgi:hypothetical protein